MLVCNKILLILSHVLALLSSTIAAGDCPDDCSCADPNPPQKLPATPKQQRYTKFCQIDSDYFNQLEWQHDNSEDAHAQSSSWWGWLFPGGGKKVNIFCPEGDVALSRCNGGCSDLASAQCCDSWSVSECIQYVDQSTGECMLSGACNLEGCHVGLVGVFETIYDALSGNPCN